MRASSRCSKIAAWGLLGVATAAAHAQTSISAPLSGSIGSPVYSESAQTGPSSSLLQGGTNLTNAYRREGTSDPLGFLIESGLMSPYAPEGALISSYTNAAVPDQIVNDSTQAERFSDYRDNRELMSGAGAVSTLAGRSAAAGSMLSASSGVKAGASGAFSGVATRAPFAAGSSALAAQQTGLPGMGSLTDPNAMLAAVGSSPAFASMQGATSTGPGAASNMTGSMNVATPLEPLFANGATSMAVPPPTGTAIGPGPGDVFPDIGISSVSATGFQDSTLGTAGLLNSASETAFSRPLLSLEGLHTDPFPSMSAESTSFLNPTLRSTGFGTPVGAGGTGGPSLSEVTRKARVHAMIYNGGSLPSAFEQRKMIRSYQRDRERQGRRHSTLTAPSVTP